jgi:hypothetical protein
VFKKVNSFRIILINLKSLTSSLGSINVSRSCRYNSAGQEFEGEGEEWEKEEEQKRE